jgi:hypothetical protein
LKVRSILLVACAGSAAALLLAAPASALDLGAISVPVPVLVPAPPVSIPRAKPPATPVQAQVAVPPAVHVGPIVVDTGKLAPGLDASVSASPTDGVDVDVTLPTSVLPIALPGELPGAVHAHVDGGGVKASTPVGGVTLPNPASGVAAPGVTTDVTVPGVPGAPVIPGVPGVFLPTTAVGGGSSPAADARVGSDPAGVRGTNPTGAPSIDGSPSASADVSQRTKASMRGGERAMVEAPFGSVNAAVQRPAPEQSSTLWRAIDAVTSRGALLFALLVIVLVARCAAAGLLRDALRRPRSVSAS